MTTPRASTTRSAPRSRARGLARHRCAGSRGIPSTLLLSLRGSGQALYVGLAEDAFVVTSEPYGLVEETDRYLRLDGETPADAARGSATRGQIVRLDTATPVPSRGSRASRRRHRAPRRRRRDRRPPRSPRATSTGVTFPHFLLKEISEAPASFRKTLRGKHRRASTACCASYSAPTRCRPTCRTRLARRRASAGRRDRSGHRGHRRAEPGGGARRDGRGPRCVPTRGRHRALGLRARDDMSDTVVVAISQSGTTTDTNRTVDLVRGARRVGDRDREPPQQRPRRQVRRCALHVGRPRPRDGGAVHQGVLRAGGGGIPARAARSPPSCGTVIATRPRATSCVGCTPCPTRCTTVLGQREAIAGIAARHVPSRRYWTVVGNGLNRIAANEVRIKLSELCYKSISADIAEDKKHIDLCTEPLILVCAVGLDGSNADDIAKEVAYHRAHRAAPIVITNDGDDPLHERGRDDPRAAGRTEAFGFVLSAMAGHLFGYEAALVDRRLRASAARAAAPQPCRTRRSRRRPARRTSASSSAEPARVFLDGLRIGNYDGNLEAATAVRLASLLRYATRHRAARPLRDRPRQGRHARPSSKTSPSRSPRRSTSSPARSTRSSTRPRRSPSASRVPTRSCSSVPLVACGARRGRVARCAQLPVAAHARRARSRGRRRSSGSPGTASRAISRPTRDDARGRHARSSFPSRTPPTRCCAAPSTASPRSARSPSCAVATTAAPSLIVPEVKGNETVGLTLLHVAFADQLPRRRRARGALGLPGSLQRAEGRSHRDRARLRRRRARDVRRRRPAHRAGLRARRPLAASDRTGRWCSGSGPTSSRSSGSGSRCRASIHAGRAALHRRRAEYASSQHDPVKSLAARFAAKEAVMKALGRRARRASRSATSRCVPRRQLASPSLALHGRADALADDRGVTGWMLSLTHTDTTAMAVVIATG